MRGRGPLACALCAVLGAGWAGCGPAPDTGPSQYVKMTYTVTPPGASTGLTPLVMAVVTDAQSCQRSSNKIMVSANLDAAGITFNLAGGGTLPQAALRADKDTGTVAEVNLKLPLMLDSRTRETSNPQNFLTSDRSIGLSCTVSISGPDPFASFDGSFSCSAQQTTLTRGIEAAGQFHALPCPPGL